MRTFAMICLALMAGLFGTPSAESYKGKITIALSGEAPTMDPHVATSTTGGIVWRWTFDTLTSVQPGTGKIGPWAAEKYEKLDAKRMKFWIRKGMKFSDGSPVTAHAFKYAMSRIFDPANRSTQKRYFRNFERVEIVDDYTLIYHSKRPDNGLLNRLAIRPGLVSLKTKGWEKARLARGATGSGPYILKSWTKGIKMVFEANPNWWGNSKYPNRPGEVTLRRIREGTTRVNALATGEVDVIAGVMPHFIPKLQKNPKTAVVAIPSVRIMYAAFVAKNGGPFADRKVRLAVNYAIDAEEIRKTLLQGRADAIGQLFHPWNYSGHNPGKEWFGYDLEKAKALMKESGYPNGFKGVFLASNGRFPADKATCEAIVGMLKKIKIDLRCDAQRFLLFRKVLTNHLKGKVKTPAMFYMGFANNHGDSSIILRANLTCGGVFSGVCYKDLSALINKAASTDDPAEQQAAYEKVTDMIKDKVTHKVLFKLHDVFGYNNRLAYTPRHDELVYPWEIGVDR